LSTTKLTYIGGMISLKPRNLIDRCCHYYVYHLSDLCLTNWARMLLTNELSTSGIVS
jgi:hypothetical protein